MGEDPVAVMPEERGGQGSQELGGLQLETEGRQVSVGSQRGLGRQRAQLPPRSLLSLILLASYSSPHPLTGWLSSPSSSPASTPSHCTTRPSAPARSPDGSARSPRSSRGPSDHPAVPYAPSSALSLSCKAFKGPGPV